MMDAIDTDDVGHLLQALDVSIEGRERLWISAVPVPLWRSRCKKIQHCSESEHGAAELITKPVDFNFLKQQLQQLAQPPA
jgi:hypothetical protein